MNNSNGLRLSTSLKEYQGIQGGRKGKVMKRQIRWREMRKTLYESLGISRTTNQSHYGQCLKESTKEHYK